MTDTPRTDAIVKKQLDAMDALATGSTPVMPDLIEMTRHARQLERELAVSDKLIEERNRVLRAIPGCEAHGDQCVPHALEWIEARIQCLLTTHVSKWAQSQS